ncbi:hypothetical protein QQ045_012381 [Rhodiola kirilowii]
MVRLSAKERGGAEGESSSRGRKRTRIVSDEDVVRKETEDITDASNDGNNEGENGEAAGVEEQADDSDHAATTDGSVSVILKDPDVLYCVICYEALKIPVFQCENGHIACSSCCTQLKNKCPCCSFPIGHNRCRAIEKVIESVRVLCQNSKYGCCKRLRLSRRKDHEDKCVHSPYTCPITSCGFKGSCPQLWRHCSDTHSESVKWFQYNCTLPFLLDKKCEYIILMEEKEDAVFILENSLQDVAGSVITVKYVCPIVPERVLSYDIMARQDINTLRLHSIMEKHSCKPKPITNNSFLLVPRAYTESSRPLKMELCIQYSNSK